MCYLGSEVREVKLKVNLSRRQEMPRWNKQVPKFDLTVKSENKKTGPMSLSRSPMQTCPEACPFRGRGCYANYGASYIWWKACSEAKGNTRTEYVAFLERVRALPRGGMFRHNQAGDLLGDGEILDEVALDDLTDACTSRSLSAFGYTHYGVIPQKGTSAEAAMINRVLIERANREGFTINISCNSTAHADRVVESGIVAPVSCILPEQVKKDGVNSVVSPGGHKIVVCPNVTKGVTCTECMLCMRPQRKFIIGFPAHGSGKKRAEEVMAEWSTGDEVPVEHERRGKYKVRHTEHLGRDKTN